jgi:hypothetical protein
MDADRLGLLLAMALSSAALGVSTPLGFAPEPDEVHYFLRFAAALVAGAGLAGAGRWIESREGWTAGRAQTLLIAALLPLTLPAYWDPPTMDGYFAADLAPIAGETRDLASWIRDNTRADAVFVAGWNSARWIPALSGRRVLLVGDRRPPRDYELRKATERRLLLHVNSEGVRRAAARYGITHVALDDSLRKEYGVGQPRGGDAYQLVFRSSSVEVYELIPN